MPNHISDYMEKEDLIYEMVTQEQMKEIQAIVGQYSLSNVYKVDESGLFYRCRPRYSYLSLDDELPQTRGTALQK